MRWRHPSRRGTVYVLPQQGGRWCIVYNEENLGSYHSPMAAIDDAAGGHTFSPSNGVDLGSLGLSDDIGDWEQF